MLFVSHKGLATGMVEGFHFIVVNKPNIDVLELGEKGIADFQRRLAQFADQLDQTKPVLLLSDVPFGSPGNTAYAYLTKAKFDVTYLSGVNLPLLLEISSGQTPQQAVATAQQAISVVSAQNTDEHDEEADF